ncbi:MAG: phosphomannomutase/phosphoglucomutase [Anaerolineae bacterium]
MCDSDSSDKPVINPHLLRGYSFRGLADRDLPDEVVARIGYAAGIYFFRLHEQAVVVGRDARLSSPRISATLISALLRAGMRVIDVALVPTPVHNFATDLYGSAAGIMVTASHNPPEYNGLKLRRERTLDAQELHEIITLAARSASPLAPLPHADALLTRTDVVPTYLEHVRRYADVRRPLKVVLDGGDGTNGPLIAPLLRALGCQVIELHCIPDGHFPHRDPDPTAPGAVDALAAVVCREAAEIGLAFDGDGDRLLVVDEQGTRILGDQIMMLLARDVLRQQPGARIVFEALCTRALHDDVIAHGGVPIVTPTGYAYVHTAVLDNAAALGGELSGHLFFNLPGFRFDDAILGALRLLSILSRDTTPLSEMVRALPAYCSSAPLRIACSDSAKKEVVARVRDHFARAWPLDELDGVRIDFGDGWGTVRASNTQPALVLRFEARSDARLTEITELVMKQVEHAMQECEVG